MNESSRFIDIFSTIADENYVVLRNYESFLDDSTLEAHPDVDMLAAKPQRIVSLLGLVHRKKRDDGIHYKMKWKDRWVSFDLRTVGDGYYDAEWEKKLLEQRRRLETFYVLGEEDYFYSLLYHAVVQKHSIAPDYVTRLSLMGEALNVDFTEAKAYELLNDYLRKNGYKYSYPILPGTIFRLDGADKDLIEKNFKAALKRELYRPVSILKKMKK